MTVEISALGRTRIAIEAAFATDETASPSNFVDLPVVEGSVQFVPMQEHLDPQVQQQFVHAFTNSKQLLGKKSSTLALTTYLAGTGAAQDGDGTWLTATTWPLFRLLKTIMGGAYQGTAGVVPTVTTGSPTTTNVPITATHGTLFALEGGAYAVVLPNGLIEAREILSFSSGAVVPKVAHSTAPAAGAQVYWPTTFHLIEGVGSNRATLQAIIEGAEAGDEYVCLGAQGTMSIDITAGQIAKLSASLTGASWARTSSFTLAAAAAAVGFSPISNLTSELLVATVGSTTRNVISHSASTWTPGFANSPIPSPEGPASSGMIGWKRSRGRGVSGSFTAYDDTGLNWLTQDSTRANLAVFQQIGMTTAGIVLLSAPTVELTSVPKRTAAGDLYGQTVEWAGRNDSAISVSTDLGRSAMRVHVW